MTDHELLTTLQGTLRAMGEVDGGDVHADIARLAVMLAIFSLKRQDNDVRLVVIEVSYRVARDLMA